MLLSKAYLDNIAFLSTHFTVPVCDFKKKFLTPEGVQSPIPIAVAYHASVTMPIDGLQFDAQVPLEVHREHAWVKPVTWPIFLESLVEHF